MTYCSTVVFDTSAFEHINTVYARVKNCDLPIFCTVMDAATWFFNWYRCCMHMFTMLCFVLSRRHYHDQVRSDGQQNGPNKGIIILWLDANTGEGGSGGRSGPTMFLSIRAAMLFFWVSRLQDYLSTGEEIIDALQSLQPYTPDVSQTPLNIKMYDVVHTFFLFATARPGRWSDVASVTYVLRPSGIEQFLK